MKQESQEVTPVDSANPKAEDWAVSVTMIRHKECGGINIMNKLIRVKSAGKDSAIGFAIQMAMEDLPLHAVHCVTSMRFN